MRSSYLVNNYGPILQGLVKLYRPQRLIEFGVLDGYSLDQFIEAAEPTCQIVAYDLFEDYPFNRSDRQELQARFGERAQYGDFYEVYKELTDESVDMFHVDISNHGSVYAFFFERYLPKLRAGGIALLEGGSAERDNATWIKQYNRPPIGPALELCPYPYFTFLPFPSLTIVTKP